MFQNFDLVFGLSVIILDFSDKKIVNFKVYTVTRKFYEYSEYWSTLMQCLEKKELKMFPVHSKRKLRKSSGVKKVHTTELYCICRMPDTHTLYVYCDKCGREFHPACISMSDEEAMNSSSVFCPYCK